jgi:hypothetical protein
VPGRIHVRADESISQAIARYQREKGCTMAQKPSDQLAALAKAARSGELRGVVSHALNSLTGGPAAFASVKATLKEYDDAVLNAQKLDEFLRGELQAEGDNGGGGSIAAALGNSSAEQPPAVPGSAVSPAGSSAAAASAPALSSAAPDGFPRVARPVASTTLTSRG